MFRLFSYNSPLNVALYAVLLFAMQIGWWFQPTDFQFFANHTEPLSKLLGSLFAEKAWQRSLGVGLVFVAATLLNQIVNEHKITPQRTYVTGAVFIVLVSLFKDFTVLCPQLVALLLAVRVIQKLFAVYGVEKPFAKVFDIGWLSALAVFFYFPAFWLLLFALVGLAILRPFVLREWWMALIGFFAVSFAVFTWYFYHDQLPNFISDVVNFNHVSRTLSSLNAAQVFGIATVVMYSVLSVLRLPKIFFSSLIQVRKYVTIMAIAVGLIFLGFSLQAHFSFNHFVLLAAPLSIFFTIYLHSIKSVFYAEVMFTLLLSCPLIIQFFIS